MGKTMEDWCRFSVCFWHTFRGTGRILKYIAHCYLVPKEMFSFLYPNFFSVLEDSANVLMFRLLADTLNRQSISLPSFDSWPFNVKLSADI